jgi:hypothetical protein
LAGERARGRYGKLDAIIAGYDEIRRVIQVLRRRDPHSARHGRAVLRLMTRGCGIRTRRVRDRDGARRSQQRSERLRTVKDAIRKPQREHLGN